jgi:hypothetical protein
MASSAKTPYSTSILSKNVKMSLDPTAQMKVYKKQEEDAIPKNTLPFELSNLPNHFGNMVDSGIQACKAMEDIFKTPDYEDSEDLKKLKRNVEKMVVYLIKNVDVILENYTIGHRHNRDLKKKDD